ncbi:ABC transporter substrate-binding protein [Lysobacter helvus]|uniref:ABC transporter substrate-binding protein n=2 Tax=Lysobacteraceae TaxID=32033 RepID=A0ABN6FVE6_9GAMM|nr:MULTISPECIES: AarF/UbiB family protein [Lysobacter]BCT93414.1 ABC transporter substrate-binding protein [Lysobacter caseinilyticus]BCT96567.1 ABC transporter substrate-binding protein [Lysobacter helvus]
MNGHSPNLARSAQILRFLLRYRGAGVFTGIDLDSASLPTDDTEIEAGAPEEFVDDLEALGPTFIKIGQALSTRPDMVPPAYLVALQRMQDEVAPAPFEAIRPVIEDELGVRISKAFVRFDEVPIGAASLAQVYRAELRDGREVAVKVQRPGVAELIRADLDTLAAMADKADRMTDIGRRIRFADWVHEFRKTLLAELDYRIEAENLARFADHFTAYPELFVPQPIRDLCATRVLTMDLVHGVKATELSGIRRTEQDLGKLGEALLRGYLDQMFVHGEIHADPHPGNLLVTNDGRLGLFDLGMIAHVPPKQRERLLKLLFACVDGRGEEVANESIAMGTRLDDFDQERFVREIGQLVSRYAAHSGSQSLSEGRLVVELVRIATACGLRTPPELSLLGKTLLNLEQVAFALDPQLDVKAIVETHIQHVMRERIKQSFSPANLANEMMEMQALVRESPRKVSDILSLLAENRLTVNLGGLDDSQLMENLQKIANRISAGVITAALILASAILMKVETPGIKLFGYPALALVLFLIGTGVGLMLVWSSLRRDHKARPKEERGPR